MTVLKPKILQLRTKEMALTSEIQEKLCEREENFPRKSQCLVGTQKKLSIFNEMSKQGFSSGFRLLARI